MVKGLMALQVSSLSQSAKQAEELLALLQFLFITAASGAVVAGLARRARRERVLSLGFIVAAVLFILTTLVEFIKGFTAPGPWLGVVWMAPPV